MELSKQEKVLIRDLLLDRKNKIDSLLCKDADLLLDKIIDDLDCKNCNVLWDWCNKTCKFL